MKPLRVLIWMFLLLFFFGHFIPKAFAQELNVLSFNIRYPNPNDGVHYWPNRKNLVGSIIRFYDADLIGLQEAFRLQLDDLSSDFPGFKWVGVCRTDGSSQPNPDNEFSAIFYNTSKLKVLKSGTFWLSPTPNIIGSKGWDAALPRIVTWAQFEIISSGKQFYHYNTHFDHMGVEARVKSAQLILDTLLPKNELFPLLVTGDFNVNPETDVYRTLIKGLDDAFYSSEMPHHGPQATFTNGFLFPGAPGTRIDYIFTNKKIRVLRHAIISENWSGIFPSDHLPVYGKILIE